MRVGLQSLASTGRRIKIFCSYAHEDEKYVEQIKKYLDFANIENAIDFWYDRKIVPGEEWKVRIDEDCCVRILMVKETCTSSLYRASTVLQLQFSEYH